MQEPREHRPSTHQRGLTAGYDESRRRFLEAVEEAAATIVSYDHPLAGMAGEPLALDVATLGPDDASSVLIVVSGTHGVEGFAGSALQHHWLADHAADRPSDVRVVLIHAFNPHGFAWVRRVNEDNVDLNRNFIDWDQPPPTNEDYGGIAHLLVPQRWDDDTQQSTTLALLAYAEEVGLERLQEVVSGGQYTHPTGVFHGGSGPVWSHRWLTDHLGGLGGLGGLVGPATRVAIVDLHTGLGPWGHGELISHVGREHPAYRRGSTWWGEVRSMVDGESVSANLSGDWLAAADRLIAEIVAQREGGIEGEIEVTSAALEFGTVDTISVLQALRADAVLHSTGDPLGDGSDAVRAQVRAAFADDDPAWFDAIAERFDEVIDAALANLTAT